MANGENIIPINIEDEMKSAYIDYSMSVIVSRALPDVRDGLKPVHRRVLYGMSDLGLSSNRPHKKSARIVGEVLGKYHPHGDTSVYDAMVRMAQDWSLRYPLVDGQGNFGSIDGDSPAAMRYTEARFKKLAEEMLLDLDKETVDFQPNFDDSLTEPSVLPSKIPNLLMNGASGIAVGMATNMLPHNLGEVVDGIVAYIENEDIAISELMQHVKGPDFPTGAVIYGYQGIKSALETGRGKVVMRAVSHFEDSAPGRIQIVITEIPYQVNKANMIEKTAALVNEKKIEGISAIRDESDKDGLRIVYELKRDAIPNVVLNNLFKYTSLQSSMGVNNIALVKGRPRLLNLKDLIKYYVEHRLEVLVRRTKYELKQAGEKAHLLQGYLVALQHIDEIIALIKAAKDPEAAKAALTERFEFSERQTKAIMEMRLQRLTGMEREKIEADYAQTMALIAHLEEVLVNDQLRKDITKQDLIEIKEKYADKRRTEIVHAENEIDIEDMIPNEEMVITISNEGYIKRTNSSEFRAQGRGGVGSKGAVSKSDDYTQHLFVAHSHNYLLIFTNLGKVYWLKVYSIPESAKATKGRPLQNLIQIEKDESVMAVINVADLKNEDFTNNHYLIMATQKGVIKKTILEAYSRPRQNGINAINIEEGDLLLDVKMTDGKNDIILALRSGKAVRFNEATVRPMGRGATGVKGITLADADDRVVGLVCLADTTADLLVVSEKGYGKRSSVEDYRITNRGGKGVRTLNITEKTGRLVTIKSVTDQDDLMIINKSGVTIRMHVSDLRVMGRNTQGVKLIRLSDTDEISSVATILDGHLADEAEFAAPVAVLEPHEILENEAGEEADDAEADDVEADEPEADDAEE